jgi:hypothetical protein
MERERRSSQPIEVPLVRADLAPTRWLSAIGRRALRAPSAICDLLFAIS